MDAYKVVTSHDLSKQKLYRGSTEILAVNKPDVSIESFVLENIEEKRAPVKIGYHNTYTWAPESPGDYPIPTFWSYVLAKGMKEELNERASVHGTGPKIAAVLNSDAGFLGNFLLQSFEGRLEFGKVFFFEEKAQYIDSAVQSVNLNHNRHGDDRGKFTNYGRFVSLKDQSALFLHGNFSEISRRLKAGIAVACPQYFSGVERNTISPYEELINIAKNLNARELWIGHSSMAKEDIEELGRAYKAIVFTVYRSRPIPLVRDTAIGAVKVKLKPEHEAKPSSYGLTFDDKGNLCHTVCASYLDFF